MSEGKFSQPRPHRDEERLIEESFRQLTETKTAAEKKFTMWKMTSRKLSGKFLNKRFLFRRTLDFPSIGASGWSKRCRHPRNSSHPGSLSPSLSIPNRNIQSPHPNMI